VQNINGKTKNLAEIYRKEYYGFVAVKIFPLIKNSRKEKYDFFYNWMWQIWYESFG